MQNPYSPRYSGVPNHTPSVSASRKPIHNPYDKFTQSQFDEWIGGITSALRKALGEEVEAEPSSGRKDDLEYSIAVGGSHGEDGDGLDDAIEDSFADLKARREKVLGKMKAVEDSEEYENEDYDSDTAPTRWLGSSPGNAIELLSSSEEEIVGGDETDEEARVRNMIRDFGSDSEEGHYQPSPGGSNAVRPARTQYSEAYQRLSDAEEDQSGESQLSQPPDIRDPRGFPKQYLKNIFKVDLPDLDRSRLSSPLTPDIESETEESNVRNFRNSHNWEFRRVGYSSDMAQTRSSPSELSQEGKEIQDSPLNHKDKSYTDIPTGRKSNSPEIRTSKVEEDNGRSAFVVEDSNVDRDEMYANDLEYDELLEDHTDREAAPEPDTPDIRERLGEHYFPTPHLQRQGSPIFTLNDRVDWTTPTFDSRISNVDMADEGDETGSDSDVSGAEVVSVDDEDGRSYRDRRSPLPLGTSDLEVHHHDSDDEQEDEEDEADRDFYRFPTALVNGHDQDRELAGVRDDSWDVEESSQITGEIDLLYDDVQDISAAEPKRPTIDESTAFVLLHDSMLIPPPVSDMGRRSPQPVVSRVVPSTEEYASVEAALGEKEVPIIELSKVDDPTRIPDQTFSGIVSDENSASVLGVEVSEQDDPSADDMVTKVDETINGNAAMEIAGQNQDLSVDITALPSIPPSISEAEFHDKTESSETGSASLAEPDTAVDSIEIALVAGVTESGFSDKSVPEGDLVEITAETLAEGTAEMQAETHVPLPDVENVAQVEEIEEIGSTDQQQDDISVEVLSVQDDVSKEPIDYVVEELVSEGKLTEEPEMSNIDWEASRNVPDLMTALPPMSPILFAEPGGEEFAFSVALETDEASSLVHDHQNELPTKDTPEFIMPIIANPNVRDPTSINHTPAVSVSSQPDTPMSSSVTLPVAAAVTKFLRDNNLSIDDGRSTSGLFTPLEGEESSIAPSPSAGNIEGVELQDSLPKQESLSETPSILIRHQTPVKDAEVVEPNIPVAHDMSTTDIEAVLHEDHASIASSSHTPELNKPFPLFSDQETQKPSIEVDHTADGFPNHVLCSSSDSDTNRDQGGNTNVPRTSEVPPVTEDSDVDGEGVPDPESATTVVDSQETKIDSFSKDAADDSANLNAEVKVPDTVSVSKVKEFGEEDPFKLMGNDSSVAPGEIDVVISDESTQSFERVDAEPKTVEPIPKESMENSAALPQQLYDSPSETKDLHNEEERSSATEEQAKPLKRKRSPSVLGSSALTRSLSQGKLRTYGKKSLDSRSPPLKKDKRADGLSPSPDISSPAQAEPSASASNGDMPMFHGHGKSKKTQAAMQSKLRTKERQDTVNDPDSLKDGYGSIPPSTSENLNPMKPTIEAPKMKLRLRLPTPPPVKPYVHLMILPPSVKAPIQLSDATAEQIQPSPKPLKITLPPRRKLSSAASQAVSSPASPVSSPSSFEFSSTTQPSPIKRKVQKSPATRKYARALASASQPTASPARRHDHNSRSTRSQCRYRKISLPEDENGPRITFLVPQCSLNDRALVTEEEITDDGPATQNNYENCYENVETLNFIPYLISVLRLVVGVELVRDNEIYYLPTKEGEVVMRRTPHGELRKASRLGFVEDDEEDEKDLPQKTADVGMSYDQISSKPTAAPVSFAESISTASSSFGRVSARSMSNEAENEEEHAPPAKRRKRTYSNRVSGGDGHVKGDSGASTAASPTSARVPKRRVKKALSHDFKLYTPHTDQESTDEDGDVPKTSKKSTKSGGLKRSRTEESSLKESGSGMVKRAKLTARGDDD